MAVFTLTPLPRIGITPIGGNLLFTYASGGTTPLATYTDSTGTIANSNPIVADGLGLFPAIYLPVGQSYKFIVQNSAGVVIWSQDGIAAIPGSAAAVDVTAMAGVNIAADQAVYLSDGSGGLNASQWYKADAANIYSSTSPWVGLALNAIAAGSTGPVRIVGQDAGISLSLSPGAVYYIGTAGALTTTAPTNARIIGQADGANSIVLGPIPQITQPSDNALCDGRLTLTTVTPVTTADVTAATTVFFTPYRGNRIALFDGTATWNIRAFSELSIAVPATTSQMYDVWVFDNAGVATLELLAWTNDTTRATALVLQNGVLVKTGATTRRYVGSFRTTAVSGQTEDSAAKRYVWNYYNRIPRSMLAVDTTDTWVYDGVLRQARANATNQLDFVIGVAEVLIDATVTATCTNTAVGSLQFVNIGLDSTTTAFTAAKFIAGENRSQVINVHVWSTARATYYSAIGRHILVWLEGSSSAGTTTWMGDDGQTVVQSGISGILQG